MANVKRVELTGSEVCVSGLGGQNVAVKNLGAGTIYASIFPDITADADNVSEIPAGGGEVVLDANGTVYLIGTGRVQCTGTDYATPNFKLPSSSESGGGGEKETLMPHMGGIVGYYTPNTLDISSGLWKNTLDGNDIILSGGSAENECLHLTENDFGSLTINEPKTIYVVFSTNSPGDVYQSVVSKKMTTQALYHDFAVVVNQNISLSCRQSLVDSYISATSMHVVCITRNDNTAKLYIDGNLQGQTRAELGDYGGEYLLNRSERGGIASDPPGEHSYKMLAFGLREHTTEEVERNSQWLGNKIFRW